MPIGLGAGKLRSTRALATHAFTLLALAAWEIASWHTPVFLLPGPASVAKSLWALISTPAGLAQTGASLFHVGTALLAAFLAGSLVALMPYYVKSLRLAIDARLTP